jgi:hypothetical protein
VPGLVSKIRGHFPASPIWIVENERDGQFPEATGSYKVARAEANVVALPPYNARYTTELTKTPLSTLLQIDRPGSQVMFDMKIGPAARELVFLKRSARGLSEAVDPIAAWFLGAEVGAMRETG